MPDYVNVPIETDPDALAQDAFDFLGAKTGGTWQPHDGQLDTWQIEANARMAATLRDIASDVPPAIFRYFGKLVNIPPIDATPATADTNWTLTDTLGHTIPAGIHLAFADAYGNLIEFQTAVDTFVPAGSSAATNVQIVATLDGSAGSSLGGPGAVMELLDQLSWVATNGVTLVDATTDGTDAEDDDDYLSRLATNLQLMAPRPILPGDFAVLARNTPGVARSMAIDGYNPADGTNNNARFVTVAVIDEAGNPVSSTIRNTVQSSLLALRETNFQVPVIDPTVTTVDVIWDATMWPGWDLVDAKARINFAIRAYLDPSVWGNPLFGDTKLWFNVTVVKINDIIGIMKNVDGLRDVNSVTIRTGTDAYAATDINLAGAAPLAKAGAVDGTAH